MLPHITEEARDSVFADVFLDVNSWRKKMIHYIKEENPEVNTSILEAAKKTSLEPKAIALGAYLVYRMLEIADKEESKTVEDFLE